MSSSRESGCGHGHGVSTVVGKIKHMTESSATGKDGSVGPNMIVCGSAIAGMGENSGVNLGAVLSVAADMNIDTGMSTSLRAGESVRGSVFLGTRANVSDGTG